jgi:O-antigen ligase
VWTKDQRTRLLFALPALIALAAVLVMKRRVGIIALDAGLVLLALALVRTNLRAALMLLPVVAVLGIIYLGTYWNETGGLGQGARSFRAVVGEESSAEDQSSRTYREIEAFNVSENIRWQPIWGSGFGQTYKFVQPVPDLSSFWPMQPYIPHNTILWSWMKGGIVALLLVLGLFGHALIRGMGLLHKRLDPLLQSWAMAATAAVLMVFLFAWWDLGLVSLRVMTVFGLCLGLLGTLAAMPEAPPGDGQSPPPGETHASQ